MSTVIENIDSLFSVKSDIRQAIVDKGVDMTSVPFTSFATKIGEISTGSDPNLIEVSVLQGEQTQEVIPEWYGDDVDGFTKVRITLDPSLPDTYKTQALNELTEATATEEDVAQGQKYYDNKGVLKTGTMQGGGADHTVEDALITKTISGEYNNPRITSVGSYMFLDCDQITKLTLQNVTTIGSSAFYRCNKISSLVVPKLTTIHSGAFFSCTRLRSLDLPEVTLISQGGFQSCYNVTSVSCPKLVTIGVSAFMWVSRMTTFDGPNVTIVSSSAFTSCYALLTVRLPKVTKISAYAFYRCSNLTTLYINSVTSVPTIYSSTFYLNSSITSIYVPESLVAKFKTASYWSVYSSKILAYQE